MVVTNRRLTVPGGANEFVAEGDLRDKNQITIPKVIVDALGIVPGDRLLFVANVESHEIRAYPVRKSYAGSLAGVYGTPDEAAAYVEGEREAWTE